MLAVPFRVLRGFRPNVPTGVIAATAVSTVVFSATPFVIPAIADDLTVGVGLVGIISTVQLLGFVLASSFTPRYFAPRRTIMTVAVTVGILAHLGSAVSPNLVLLATTRWVAGISLGLIAWVAWAEVFGDEERVGDVAIIGPIVGTIAAPVMAAVIDVGSWQGVYLVLAGLYVVPGFFIRSLRFSTVPPTVRQQRHQPTAAARRLLIALGLFTCGGSSVFVFAADIGIKRANMSTVVVALAFSANALAAIPSARFRGPRKLPGLWMAITGVCAFTIAVGPPGFVFLLALMTWGFSFWMAIPGVFNVLAAVSAYPEQRAGDAQAIMALGRVIGPTFGGLLYSANPLVLGTVGSGLMIVSGAMVTYTRKTNG